MENQQCISKLDASMIRCGVSFIFSYQFNLTIWFLDKDKK